MRTEDKMIRIWGSSHSYFIQWIHLDFGSHLLDPRSRREFAFDMPVGGENAIGEEKPERGSAANRG